MIGHRCEVEILGEAPRTIIGKMGERAVNPKVIRKILDKQVSCCSSKCLRRWVESLGEKADVVLEGHRYAVAAMSEVARQHFFVQRIKDLLVPKMRHGAHGQGKLIVGRCCPLVSPPLVHGCSRVLVVCPSVQATGLSSTVSTPT